MCVNDDLTMLTPWSAQSKAVAPRAGTEDVSFIKISDLPLQRLSSNYTFIAHRYQILKCCQSSHVGGIFMVGIDQLHTY